MGNACPLLCTYYAHYFYGSTLHPMCSTMSIHLLMGKWAQCFICCVVRDYFFKHNGLHQPLLVCCEFGSGVWKSISGKGGAVVLNAFPNASVEKTSCVCSSNGKHLIAGMRGVQHQGLHLVHTGMCNGSIQNDWGSFLFVTKHHGAISMGGYTLRRFCCLGVTSTIKLTMETHWLQPRDGASTQHR